MGIVGHGIDIVEIESFAILCQSVGYINRCFTRQEQAHSKGKPDRLAARFAAKEAVLKTLRLGIVNGVSLKDVEVTFRKDGSPSVRLSGVPLQRATENGIREWHITFSHGDKTAIASVIAVGTGRPNQ